jgi:deoxyribodipyrimidine photo-lyase
MPSPDVQPERIQPLNDLSPDGGDYVLYWMQQSQRPEDNPALEYAIQRANEAGLPVLVVFGLMDDYPEANLRHYTFMIEGLQETKQILEEERGIRMVVAHGSPDEVALQFADRAHTLVCDRGYLDHQRTWRERVTDRVTEEATCPVVRVEGDVIVPVETVSDKSEYAARTIRPRIWEHAERFFVDLEPTEPEHPSTGDVIDLSGVAFEPIDVSDVEAATDRLDLDRSVSPVSSLYRGGPRRGKDVIESFITEHMRDYDGKRNKPETSAVSYASMFLHFGQVSPVWIANRIRESGAPEQEIDSYIEELMVRRELTMNFCYYNRNSYDSLDPLPDWARTTLEEHADDEREYLYSFEELRDSQTHDPYWNAAMTEMRETGYMHNYMRMYWGKKILEWSPSPEEAHDRILTLNNTYFLDGRDPNSYSNVLWIFGLHDRAWQERPVYGKTRYMSKGGLERKADPDAYVKKVQRLKMKATG